MVNLLPFMLVLAIALIQPSRDTATQPPALNAQQIYRSAEQSVFLVYVTDSKGSPTALGSAFLVAPRRLITNAHVIEGGIPVLAVGPVRIPLRLLGTDDKNDLAILAVDADIASMPLHISEAIPDPGEIIFAIGNPEGLEKSISQGIVSGIRTRDGRELLQISSPISHGSSGGPIINSQGNVVGVAVGMLEEGQNLNFAVPSKFISLLLNYSAEGHLTPLDTAAGLREAKRLAIVIQNKEYSDDSKSDYQQSLNQLKDLLHQVSIRSNNLEELRQIACLGTTNIALSDLGIGAAKKVLALRQTSESHALLSFLLYDRANNEAFLNWIATKNSNEAKETMTSHQQFLDLAIDEATRVTEDSTSAGVIRKYVIGGVLSDEHRYAEAIRALADVANGNMSFCTENLSVMAFQKIISADKSLDNDIEQGTWFSRYERRFTPTTADWDSEGARRANVKDHHGAADAYENASTADYLNYDICYASVQASLEERDEGDRTLTDGRKCVAASVNTQIFKQKSFAEELPLVYRGMALVLSGRGVQDQALALIKESVILNPNDPWALCIEATILKELQRYNECIAAAQQAIRGSDGKYASMHATLGDCYFAVENWNQAEKSYEHAAELEITDSQAAFNVGVSYGHMNSMNDAKRWLQEALRRKPTEVLRSRISTLLQQIPN